MSLFGEGEWGRTFLFFPPFDHGILVLADLDCHELKHIAEAAVGIMPWWWFFR